MLFHRLSPVALAALAVFPSGSAYSIRGSEEPSVFTTKNEFTCSLSAFDEGTCKSTSDDDGDACVWCAYQTFGFCVSPDQSAAIEEAVPQISCGDEDDASPETAEHKARSKIPDSFWECLANTDEDTCLGADDSSCTWCNTRVGFGLCVSSEAAAMADGQTWVDCDGGQEDSKEDVSDPYDTTCILAGINSDDAQSACAETNDADGDACVWCDVASGVYGICLAPDQADAVSQFISCDSKAVVDDMVAQY